MRRLVYFILLVALVGGGSYLLAKRDEIKSPGDIWTVVQGSLPTFESSGGSKERHLPPVKRSGETIHIASFNLQVLGQSKISKPHVVDLLSRIIRRYDVVAVQEVCSQDQSLLPHFVDAINSTGRHYDYVVGPRLGPAGKLEQYAYIFDTASVEIDRSQIYTVSDPDGLFDREPLVAWFRVRGPEKEEAFTFSLVNLHIEPEALARELPLVDQVISLVRDDGREEDDVILLGDLCAGDREFQQLYSYSRTRWAISHMPTTTRADQQLDNLVFHEQATSEFTGKSGVFDFFTEFNMTLEEALEVTDHLPVWAEFSIYEGGIPGRIALAD